MSQTDFNPQPSILAVFRNRNFTRMWFATLISQFGSGITTIAASILVYRITGSALSVGLMLVATSLPGLIFGLIAGVFVDRVDRKRIMVAAELTRGVLVLMLPMLLPLSIAWLYVIVLLSSIIAQFYNPAYESVLPDVANDEELAAATSLISISSTGAMGLGFAAAGFITSHLPIELAFVIDAVTFFASALLTLTVAIPAATVVGKASVRMVFRNLAEGGRFLLNSPVLRSAFIVLIPMSVIFGFQNALLLPFSTRVLHANEFEYGLIEGVGLIGFVAAGFFMAVVADRLREGQWMAIGFIGMGLGSVLFSQAQSVPPAIAIYIVVNFMNVPLYVGRRLIIQRNTRRELRGRVTSAFLVLRDFMLVVGMGLAGVADIVDIRLLVFAGGALLAVTGLITLFMPGLGRPAAEWRRAITLLRGVAEAPDLAAGRPVTLVDLARNAATVPVLASLSLIQQQRLITEMRYIDADTGTAIVRYGDESDAAYFILSGHAIVGRSDNGQERILEVLHAGDFFGEIAALTGVSRTANVVVDERSLLMRLPSTTLQAMCTDPALNSIFYSKIKERMVRINSVEVSRSGGLDQAALRELRSTESLPKPTATEETRPVE